MSDEEFSVRVAALSAQPLDVSDLRIAFECLRGDRAAITKLTELLKSAASTLARDLIPDEDMRSELCQQTHVLLLYGGPRNERGYLLTYGGRAPLVVWLRTALVRQGVALKRRRDKERPFDIAIENDATDRQFVNPELVLLKQKYADEFTVAFQRSLAALPARDRLVLRYHLVDKLTAEQIGTRFKVHRVTVARWMRNIREVLLEMTKVHLSARLQEDADDLDLIFGLIESQIQVSLTALYSERSAPGDRRTRGNTSSSVVAFAPRGTMQIRGETV